MQRYIVASVLIGCAALAGVALLYYAGVFDVLTVKLEQFYVAAELFPVELHQQTAHRWLILEWVLLVASAFGVAWCVVDVPQVGQKMLFFLSLIIVVSGLSFTLALYGVTFSPFSTLSAASASLMIGLIYAGTEQGMRKRVLQNVLGSRVSAKSFSDLINAKEMISLQGGSHEVTVLTCRLFNHAELSAKMEAADLVALTNRFLHNTADFLMSRGAYLDESSPDCVRVFFGLLAGEKNHAHLACQTAIELKQRLLNLDVECENRWFQRPEHGVAIGSGEMTVGVYGSPRHYYFSGVGLVTDFSRRVCAMNRIYGSDVLVDARTFQLTSDQIEVRPMEMIYDSESKVMTEVYELLSLVEDFSEQDRRCRDLFWEAMIHYREKDFSQALEKFSQVKQSEGEADPALDFFIDLTQERLTRMEQESGASGDHQINQGHARLLNRL
ncbi:MAG: adenylate/guanylate cyclase domain-containing protein [Verrucomicrobiales bacterium]|nr:adenylate/guanylate cyclase domain-containing protein [Verrucomicrobiales bacterium]